MLGIRRETDYAVRTVLHLASLDEGVAVPVRDIAEQRLLPLSFVRRIVARLSAAGILATTRGMGGGVRLARPAAAISLLEVVIAMDDGPTLNQCLDPRHTCPLAAGCPAHRVWAGASAVLSDYLSGYTFATLAKGPRHVEAHRRLQAKRAPRLPAARLSRPAAPSGRSRGTSASSRTSGSPPGRSARPPRP